MTGSPRFLGNPNAYMPCSTTPAGPWRDAVLRQDIAFRSFDSVGSRNCSFVAQSHGLHTPCVRFTVRVFPTRATLGSGCRHTWPGGEHSPQGSNENFREAPASLPNFPGLAWRTETQHPRLPRLVDNQQSILNLIGCQGRSSKGLRKCRLR